MEAALHLFKLMNVKTPHFDPLKFYSQKKDSMQKEVPLVGYSSILGIPIPNYGVFDGEDEIFIPLVLLSHQFLFALFSVALL